MKELKPETQAFLDRVSNFIDTEIRPNESLYQQQMEEGGRWCVPPIMEEMKAKAKAEGLWNFFLPGYEGDFGTGLTNFEYSHLAEKMGAVGISSEVFNCSAPDTGNMEVLERYGTEEQKEQWLKPLLSGEIRSAFGMTEPGVASSDATNMAATAVLDGDEYVINGEKWWTSGAGDPRCKVIIFMCVTDQDPDSPRHKRHSQILVPTDAEGIETRKMMEVFGWDDAPHGHAHLKFTNVRVPKSNMILGDGRGFEIAQGRLGPGRFQYAMTLVGNAQRCLELMCARADARVAFGEKLKKKTSVQHEIARSRCDIEQARLLTMQAASVMDSEGVEAAKPYISMVKIVAPNMAQQVADRAMQVLGGMGVCQDTLIPEVFTHARICRIADGPDEVHMSQLAKLTMRELAG